MSTLEQLIANRIQIKQLQEDNRNKVKELFNSDATTFFAEFPELVAYRWSQYTPYFNDGEACVFSSHHGDPEFKFAATDEEAGDYEDGFESDYYFRDDPKKTEVSVKVTDFLNLFNDEDMLNLFDDHVRVTVTSNGAEAEEYSHD